jgi:acyl carrier protein
MTFKEAEHDKSKLKQAIKDKWKDLLEIEDDIAEDVSFFDLGGNSLTAGIVFADIETQLGVKLAISEAYDYDTVESLAERILTLSK